MSLKAEQILDNNFFTESAPRIYTTGAYLVPMEIEKNGEKRYVWIIDEFDDDTYSNDGELCSPILYTYSKDYLLKQ